MTTGRERLRAQVLLCRQWVGGHRPDVAISMLVGGLGFAIALRSSVAVLPRTDSLAMFGSDTERVVRHMTVRAPMLDRAQFHPLVPLMTQPLTELLELLGMSRFAAVRVVMAMFGGSAATGVYLLGRRRGLSCGSAAAPAVLLTVSGAAVFFFAIPETFGIAAATLVWTLLVVNTLGQPARPQRVAAALVLSSSAILTGFIAPLVAGLQRLRPRRRIFEAVAFGLLAAVVLAGLQRLVAGTQLQFTVESESQFLRGDIVRSAALNLRVLLIDTWIAPRPTLSGGVVTMAESSPFAGGLLSWVAVAVMGMVSLAAWSELLRRRSDPVVLPVIAALMMHLVLHTFYGDEPFLYAPLAVPFLVAVVVVGSSGRLGKMVTVGCWVAIPLLAVVNLDRLEQASTLLRP